MRLIGAYSVWASYRRFQWKGKSFRDLLVSQKDLNFRKKSKFSMLHFYFIIFSDYSNIVLCVVFSIKSSIVSGPVNNIAVNCSWFETSSLKIRKSRSFFDKRSRSAQHFSWNGTKLFSNPFLGHFSPFFSLFQKCAGINWEKSSPNGSTWAVQEPAGLVYSTEHRWWWKRRPGRRRWNL